MSWRIPIIRPANGDVLNTEAFDAFAHICEELAGRLNEHNFDDGAYSSRTQLEEDAGVQFAHAYTAADPGLGNRTTPSSNSNYRVEQFRAWSPVPDGASSFWQKTVNPTLKEWLHIIASGQALVTDGTSLVDSSTLQDVSFKMAISVDGVVQEDQGVGMNDQSTFLIGYATGPWGQPIYCEALVEVDPGPHVIQVVIFCEIDDYGGTAYVEVFNKELIVIRRRS